MIWHRTIRKEIRPWLAATITILVVSACTEVPELDSTIPGHIRKAPYPKLVPLDRALISAPLPQVRSEELEKSLAARQARLQARARDLNSPVVDAASRKRMQDGVGQ